MNWSWADEEAFFGPIKEKEDYLDLMEEIRHDEEREKYGN